MSVAAACTLPPVKSGYKPTGTESKLDQLTIYETQDTSPTRLLICVYDIFGYHPCTKQFADKLGQSGFRVVMPDFFRGEPYSMENFPPQDWEELFTFVRTKGSWENIVKKDVENIIAHYKGQGVSSVGIFGFCWGAKICCEAGIQLADVNAIGLVHPSFVETDDGDKIQCPTYVMPSKDETDFLPFYNKLKERLGDDKVEHKRFDDMHHGFAAARANLEDELNRKRMDEAINLLHTFFNKHLK